MFNKIKIIDIEVSQDTSLPKATKAKSESNQFSPLDYLNETVVLEVEYENGELSTFEMPRATAKLIRKLINAYNFLEPHPYESNQREVYMQAAEYINNKYFGAAFNLIINERYQLFYKVPVGDNINDYDVFRHHEWEGTEKVYIDDYFLVARRHKMDELINTATKKPS